MTNTINKIGLIQTTPLPGDFSNNLRAIVQGYRECLDHGAELVVAPASALCGLEPGHLALRRSFINQTMAALESLSKELGTAPLLLGAYTLTLGDDEVYVGIVGEDDDENDPWMVNDRSIILTPYLLEKDTVTELEDCHSFNVLNTDIYLSMSDEELLPDVTSDLMVRMPSTPWYAGAARDDSELRGWEASMTGCPVVCVRAVGTIGGNIYGGGSAVYSSEGKAMCRLPLFETAAKVVDVTRPAQALQLPEDVEQLGSALERGIRDNVRNNCFSGVCIPMDHPHSPLLAALSIEALGTANVCGITFDKENKLAEKLGISCFTPQTGQLEEAARATMSEDESSALIERMRTAIALTHAESRGLMLCSPLGRREIMLGDFRMYGLSGGHLAPLGNLYDIDIFLLSERYKDQYPDLFGALTTPPHGTTNRIIHELADLNTPPSTLLQEGTNYIFKENDVRLIQRKIVASAIKRSQLPIILHADAPIEQLHFPISHRMND
ncbi:MAG: hypothetical protein J6R92_04500 [Akkermansia sp.]|nr:hypothetical protein [Akkermansia sp.]